MIYNILFVLKSFEVGGLEVVTSFLANKFVREGSNVSIVAFDNAEYSIEDRLDDKIKKYVLNGLVASSDNVQTMKNILINDKIHIVINQWGLPIVPIKVVNQASKGLDLKVISVFHNNPCFNGRIQSVQIKIDKTSNPIKIAILKLKKFLFREITAYGMRYNYYHSDKFMVLSPSFVDEFKKFTRIKNPKHLVVQTNPITIDYSDYTYSLENKQKEVIYVGRLDYMQKRVYRIIDTWKLLQEKYPDWKLSIIGVGEEEESLKKQVSSLNLKNISFEGYQKPNEYYKRASLLVLASEFEGFPLVLAECMSFGVVPVVYASYPAVYDIIRDDENGKIVNPENGLFVTELMAKALDNLMNDEKKRNNMAKSAIETAIKDFSIDAIYRQWIDLFNNLNI